MQIVWFADVAARVQLVSFSHLAGIVRSRNHHDWRGLQRFVCFYFSEHLQTRLFREVKIQKYDIGTRLPSVLVLPPEHIESLVAVAHTKNAFGDSGLAKGFLRQSRCSRIILDDEHLEGF